MSLVYFIRPIGMAGPVKIGHSTDPDIRLATYNVWSPFPLEVVATIEGDHRLELRFHARFRHLNTHHEWFRADPELDAAIAQIAAGVFDVTELPEGRRIFRIPVRSKESRETSALRAAPTRRTVKVGLRAPDSVRAADWALTNAVGDERAAAVATIREYLSDPLRFGTPDTGREAKVRLQAYRARVARRRPQTVA